MSNGKFRKNKVYFTQVSNTALRDVNLSLKAKGLYSIIQSYITIENFILYKDYLQKQCKEKDTAFDTAWKELKDKGYLIQYKSKNERGQFDYEYELLDTPVIPSVENPKVENPGVDFQGVDNPGMENPGGGDSTGGKQGCIYNTDSNNTDLNNTEGNNTEGSNTKNLPPSTISLIELYERRIEKLDLKTTMPKFLELCSEYQDYYHRFELAILDSSKAGVSNLKDFEIWLIDMMP